MAISRRNHIQTSLAFVIAYKVQIIYSVGEGGPSSENIASTSNGPTRFAYPPTSPSNGIANAFIANCIDVNQAIEIFSREYNLQHQSCVTVDRELEETGPFEAGIGLYYGVLRLKFSSQRDGQNIRSSVFIKIIKLSEWQRIGTKLMHYDKEDFMYHAILPTMYRFWQREKFSPNFYGSTPRLTLIIENLRESGYSTAEDFAVNLPMCVQVFRTLAQFHALSSVVLNTFTVEYLDTLTVTDRSSFITGDEYLNTMLRKYKKHLIPLLSEDMRRELESMANNIVFVLKSAYSLNDGKFNVILHGNVNRMNVFYPSDSQNRSGATCKFVDFINSRRGSPVIDLMNFLITSVPFEVFASRSVTLFECYLDELGTTLRELRPNDRIPYRLGDLYEDLKTYKSFFVYKLTFDVPQYWTGYEEYNTDDEMDSYDYLLQSEDFITFFKNWMEVFMSW